MPPRRKLSALRVDEGDDRESGEEGKIFEILYALLDDREVYAKEIADALEADLQPLATTSGLITRISKYDTNPANNPQSPQRPRERG